MRQFQLLSSLTLCALVACSGNVNLGGPRVDGGTAADSGSDSVAPSAANDAGGDSASSSLDGGADPAAALGQAEGYANGNAACVVDSDCCVVFDACVNRGLVVGVADKDKVASLLAEYDDYEGNIGTASVCTGCVPPPIQVTCVNHKCIGTTIPFILPDGGEPDPSFMQNHCGSTPNAPVSSHSGSVLGC